MNEETKTESLLDGDFSCETTEDWEWQTGMPKEMGKYIITTNDGEARTIYFHPKEAVDLEFFEIAVVAWCKLSDIEPYKEEQNE